MDLAQLSECSRTAGRETLLAREEGKYDWKHFFLQNCWTSSNFQRNLTLNVTIHPRSRVTGFMTQCVESTEPSHVLEDWWFLKEMSCFQVLSTFLNTQLNIKSISFFQYYYTSTTLKKVHSWRLILPGNATMHFIFAFNTMKDQSYPWISLFIIYNRTQASTELPQLIW